MVFWARSGRSSPQRAALMFSPASMREAQTLAAISLDSFISLSRSAYSGMSPATSLDMFTSVLKCWVRTCMTV